jgi:hypothetical protein
MIMPPLVMWLRVDAPGHRPVRMWLPLFLLWLVLLPLMVLILAVAVIADIALYLVGASYHSYTLLLLRCLQVLAETRGTVVRVRGPNTIVDMTIA